MHCQRHENDAVPKAEVKFFNFGIFANFLMIFAHLSHSLF